MMGLLQNAQIAGMMRALGQARAQTRAGTVTGYDPDTYMATVNISPEDVPTGWLPILSQWTGNGFGLYAGPSIGDQVIVLHLEDDFESGMIVARVNDDTHRAPSVPSGEAWIVHSSQSALKFLNNGDVMLASNRDLNVDVVGDLNATVTGDASISANGNVVVDGAQIELGGAGGKRIVLDGDPVSGGVVIASSTKVTGK